MAAQYGQTTALYHLALKWSADTDGLDGDGRTPLHWAAYKGFAGGAGRGYVSGWVLGGHWGCSRICRPLLHVVCTIQSWLAALSSPEQPYIPTAVFLRRPPPQQTRCACCWCWARAATCPTRRVARRCTGPPSEATPRRARCCCRWAAWRGQQLLPPSTACAAAAPLGPLSTQPSCAALLPLSLISTGRRRGGAGNGGQHRQHALAASH